MRIIANSTTAGGVSTSPSLSISFYFDSISVATSFLLLRLPSISVAVAVAVAAAVPAHCLVRLRRVTIAPHFGSGGDYGGTAATSISIILTDVCNARVLDILSTIGLVCCDSYTCESIGCRPF
jgi:hypothetical protein